MHQPTNKKTLGTIVTVKFPSPSVKNDHNCREGGDIRLWIIQITKVLYVTRFILCWLKKLFLISLIGWSKLGVFKLIMLSYKRGNFVYLNLGLVNNVLLMDIIVHLICLSVCLCLLDLGQTLNFQKNYYFH